MVTVTQVADVTLGKSDDIESERSSTTVYGRWLVADNLVMMVVHNPESSLRKEI